MRLLLVKLISTFFYVGYLKGAPGTYGSLAGIMLYLVGAEYAVSVPLFLLVTAAGFLVSGTAEKVFHRKDPSCVVIDEVSGMLLSLLFLPIRTIVIVCAFLLFRLLDILKPFPLRGLQRLKGSAGIMSDDLLAGLCVNVILHFGLKFVSLRIW